MLYFSNSPESFALDRNDRTQPVSIEFAAGNEPAFFNLDCAARQISGDSGLGWRWAVAVVLSNVWGGLSGGHRAIRLE